jgi:glycosyltransferase involved in cell wall biosynthesis
LHVTPGLKSGKWAHQDNLFNQMAHREAASRPEKFFNIGTVVNLSDNQEIEILFQAAEKCLEVIPNLQLIVIGDGPERKNLAWLAQKMNLGPLVWFVGEQKFLNKWLANFRVFISAARTNGLNEAATLMHVMLSGVPVIIRRGTGLDEFINHEDNGLILEKPDSEDLARAIIGLKQNSRLARRLAKQAKERVVNDHNPEIMLKEFEQAL